MYAHRSQPTRLKSRKRFLKSTSKLKTRHKARWLNLWKDKVTSSPLEIKEEGSTGFQLPFLSWKSLNRLRTGTTRCKVALMKWGFSDKFECGITHNPEHLLTCPNLKVKCTKNDLILANDKAIYVADYWRNSI